MGLPHFCGGLLCGRLMILRSFRNCKCNGKIDFIWIQAIRVQKLETTNGVTAIKLEVYPVQGLPALSTKTLRISSGTEQAG